MLNLQGRLELTQIHHCGKLESEQSFYLIIIIIISLLFFFYEYI